MKKILLAWVAAPTVPATSAPKVNWAEYPDEGLILLANLDLARPRAFDLHRNGKTERVTLAPKGLRRL